MKNENTYKSIWETLSKIDCSEHIEQIQYGNRKPLSYLSWAWAWGILMEHYPQATYKFVQQPDTGVPYIQMPDGTAEVRCIINIDNCQREMWLAVMDNKNNSVVNPSSTQINYSKMRCLTKCLAMFGLGHFIYAGEDIPSGEDKKPEDAKNKKSEVKDKHDEAWAKLFVESIELLIKKSKTVEGLESLYANDTNKPQFNILKERYADMSEEILNKFKLKKTEIQNEEN